MAKKRFEKLQRNLKAYGTFYTIYRDVIHNFLQQGICEDVPAQNSQAEKTDAVKYYLPHHAVLRDQITMLIQV